MASRMRTLAAGAIGGLTAGAALSAGMLLMERATARPSVLVVLGRKAAARLGSPYRYKPEQPAPEEQAMSHGGHLALSAMLGAAYPAVRAVPGLGGAFGGAAFGVAAYGLLWGSIGPLTKLTPTPRQEGMATVAGRMALHAGFGLLTAGLTGILAPRRPA